MTRSKRTRRAKVPTITKVRIMPRDRKITPALPAAIPRVRAKKGKR